MLKQEWETFRDANINVPFHGRDVHSYEAWLESQVNKLRGKIRRLHSSEASEEVIVDLEVKEKITEMATPMIPVKLEDA